MDKLVKYMVRHGLYAAPYLSMFYKSFSVLHDYNSRSGTEEDYTFTYRPVWWLMWLMPFKIRITIKDGKATMFRTISVLPVISIAA